MQPMRIALEDRGVLSVSGPDARPFLQGIITNDIDRVDRARTIYAALLTPQGKFLFDFIVCDDGEGGLLLDTARDRLDGLATRLDFYKLRARVDIADAGSRWHVTALVGERAAETAGLAGFPGNARHDRGSVVTVDPRLAGLGVRSVHRPDRTAFPDAGEGTLDDYEALRMALAVPKAGSDILVDKSFALESNFDHLNAIDFEKGCYVGQELTARTRYRGTVRRRLFRVTATGNGRLPAPGTPVVAGKAQIGELRSTRGSLGIALIRMDRLEEAGGADADVRADTVPVRPEQPEWLELG